MISRIAKIIFGIGVILSVTSCRQPETLPHSGKETIIQEVKTTLTNYYADVKKWGLAAEFNYLDSSSNFFWVPPGYSSALSYDSVATILKKNAAGFSLVDNIFDTLTIIPLSKELATYTGRLRSSMTDTSGNTNSFMLVETGLVTRQNGHWRLLCGQTNLLQTE